MATPERWDIFCKAIDNYGDAGVCWRLARELATEHAIAVTLWLDDLAPLAALAPGVDVARDEQGLAGIAIRRWREPIAPTACADVVVEAFGCGLPDPYVAAMESRAAAPPWFVLEYLSAESWIDESHGLPSPHPRLPFVRRFWFPGFTPQSGGLLRERGLLEARASFAADSAVQHALWTSLAIPAPATDELRVSMFCYPNQMLLPLLEAWSGGDVRVRCIVPGGVGTDAIARWSGCTHGSTSALVRGQLAIHPVPFLAQDDYDRLLWACAVNFVRGEDSFVRAQWAARPFVWNVYAQAEGAHWRKHDAFVDRYAAELATEAGAALRRLSRAWNGDPGAGALAQAWRRYVEALPILEGHAITWARMLASLPELAAGLVKASWQRYN